jgi:hypothetical protein
MAKWVRADFSANSGTLRNAYVDVDAYPFIHVVPNATVGGWSIEVNNLFSVVFTLHGNWATEALASEALYKLLQGYELQ